LSALLSLETVTTHSAVVPANAATHDHGRF